MAPNSGGLPSGMAVLLGLGLLGAGAFLRDCFLLLSGDAGASRGLAGSMVEDIASQQRLAAMDLEIAELHRQLHAHVSGDRGAAHGAALASKSKQQREDYSSRAASPGELASLRQEPHGMASKQRDDYKLPAHPVVNSKALPVWNLTADSVTAKSLIAAGRTLTERLKTCCIGQLKARGDSITWFEAMSILAAAHIKKIDVLIESGVASGFSSEIWGRFYTGSPVKIYSIDKNSEGLNDNEAARKRLAPYPNVQFIEGDSLNEIPKILERHRGQRIGVFIDGPKTHLAARLALEVIEQSTDVQFVGVHDVANYSLFDDGLFAAENAWQRVVLRTWQQQWRQEFSHLEGCSPDPVNKCGWGMLIAASSTDMQLSDDDRAFSKALQIQPGVLS